MFNNTKGHRLIDRSEKQAKTTFDNQEEEIM